MAVIGKPVRRPDFCVHYVKANSPTDIIEHRLFNELQVPYCSSTGSGFANDLVFYTKLRRCV